jgi:hypothetical protein
MYHMEHATHAWDDRCHGTGRGKIGRRPAMQASSGLKYCTFVLQPRPEVAIHQDTQCHDQQARAQGEDDCLPRRGRGRGRNKCEKSAGAPHSSPGSKAAAEAV